MSIHCNVTVERDLTPLLFSLIHVAWFSFFSNMAGQREIGQEGGMTGGKETGQDGRNGRQVCRAGRR